MQSITLVIETTDGKTVTITTSRSCALKLMDELWEILVEGQPAVTLDRAKQLLAPEATAKVSRMWNCMVRSGAFDTKCPVCGVGSHYCPHHERLTFTISDIGNHVDDFKAAMNRTPNAGVKMVELAKRLAAKLREELSSAR